MANLCFLRLFAEYNVICQACCCLITMDEVLVSEKFGMVKAVNKKGSYKLISSERRMEMLSWLRVQLPQNFPGIIILNYILKYKASQIAYCKLN